MTMTLRSYLTGGVAALGAGAIALTPVQALPSHTIAPERAVSNLAVELAASIDPITPWVETIRTSVENALALNQAWWDRPFPIAQTWLANQVIYLQELPNIGLIFNQFTSNITNAIQAPFAADPANISDEVVATVDSPLGQLPISQQTVWAALPTALGDLYDALKPALDFTTTPISGLLLGFAGPGLSSMIQLSESIGVILKDPDITNKINALLNLPADLTNAGLNGGKTLDLTPLVATLLPPEVKSIGIATGGVLNGGGVAFDAVAADAALTIDPVIRPPFTVELNDPGIPVGLVGSVGTVVNKIADSIAVEPPAPAQVRAAAAEAPAADAEASEPETPAGVEVPAPKRLSAVAKAVAKARSVVGSGNSGNEKAGQASSRGMAKSSAARGVR